MSDKGIYLVTGATGGLGQGVTRRLLATGARVAALERSGKGLDAMRASLDADAAERLECHKIDVTDEEIVAKVFADYSDQKVLGVVHLVGGYAGGTPIDQTPLSDLQRMIALNLTSAFLIMRAGARLLTEQDGSQAMIFVGSVTGRSGGKDHGPYAATKAAVHSLVRSAAADLAERGVRVNAVLPTMIATEANLAMMPDADHSMWVTPDAIGATIEYLLSDGAQSVTGACMEIAGKSYQPD